MPHRWSLDCQGLRLAVRRGAPQRPCTHSVPATSARMTTSHTPLAAPQHRKSRRLDHRRARHIIRRITSLAFIIAPLWRPKASHSHPLHHTHTHLRTIYASPPSPLASCPRACTSLGPVGHSCIHTRSLCPEPEARRAKGEGRTGLFAEGGDANGTVGRDCWHEAAWSHTPTVWNTEHELLELLELLRDTRDTGCKV